MSEPIPTFVRAQPGRVGAIVVATLVGAAAWARVDGPGWLDDEWPYKLGSIAALVAVVAALAAVALAVVSAFEGEPWALFVSRRPSPIAALALVSLLSVGALVSGFAALEQGDTMWESSDKGVFAGGVVHFLAIGGLVVALWWKRAVTAVLVAAPVVTGALAFVVAPLGGWASEDADFRDDATVADGFMDVFPYTSAAALFLAAILTFVMLRRRVARPGRDPSASR